MFPACPDPADPAFSHPADLPYPAPDQAAPYSLPARDAFTFAPNVAAETYNDLPPLIEPPESTLFPPAPAPAASRKTSHAKKKPDDWIPRPPNAFILFRSEMVEQFIKSQHVPGAVEANHGNLSKIIGLCWRTLPFAERDVWEAKARLATAAHKAKYPHYRFRPAPGPRTAKRRVREPPAPPDERRCEDIAGLLVGGVKGARLASAVAALDAARLPDRAPPPPRFDAPVTAARFRRAASAPAPVDPPSAPPRPGRPRAKSSDPATDCAPAQDVPEPASPTYTSPVAPPAEDAPAPAPPPLASPACDAAFLDPFAFPYWDAPGAFLPGAPESASPPALAFLAYPGGEFGGAGAGAAFPEYAFDLCDYAEDAGAF